MKPHPVHVQVAALLREVAATVVLPRFGALAAGEVEEKAPGDLVTIADREAEERLRAGLEPLLAGARVIGEEAVAADPSLLAGAGAGLLWLIDPIDGTGNFAAGRAPFGLMIALVEDGAPAAGWIYDPLRRRLCQAMRGQGAYVDGKRVFARETGSPLPLAALGARYLNAERRADVAERSDGRLRPVDVPNCAAEQYPRVVLGANDVALFERALPWDHAAGALFVEEAGGRVARPDGTPYRVGDERRGLIAAASPAMWNRAADILFG